MKVAVIIPALNEEEALPHVLQALPRPLAEAVIVVDNGSTDRTAVMAREWGAAVVEEPRRGYGVSCRRGLEALPPGTEVVVFLDGDFSDHPEELPCLLEPIVQGEADLVIGSRVLGPSEPGALAPLAWWGNRLAVFLIRLFWGFRYTDLGPFRAIRLEALRRLELRDRGFGWNVEMQVRALQEGLRVVERPVSYRRRLGRSKISGTISGTIKAGVKILYVIFRLALFKKKRR
ncbi:MAG: glycosyltransferase family 2 protein [Planctomycetes bacterium]|nr:glycosyltransferase family 2 protein [Planctomycetota bacterium]